MGADELELPPIDEHYEPGSREALHHVERLLFEDEAPQEPVDAGEAISFHSAGGERAEVELVAAAVLRLLRDEQVAPGDVAVVFREPRSVLVAARAGLRRLRDPVLDRPQGCRFGHTGLGRGLLALIRASAPDGTAEDLLAYLRTPGPAARAGPGRPARGRGPPRRRPPRRRRPRALGARPLAARRARPARARARHGGVRRGARDAARAPVRRALRAHRDRPQRAAARGGARAERGTARAARAALGARRPPRSTSPHVLRVLEQLEVHLGETPQPDRVQVAKPEAIRARRFDAVFACGLQEGEFPRGASPEPFLSDDDRRAIATRERARAARARGPARPRALPVLRLRVARRAPARAELALERRGGQSRRHASYFVDDVREPARRGAGAAHAPRSRDVTWSPEEAPTAAEWERAHAAAGPRRPAAGPAAAHRRAAARGAGRPRRRGRPARSRTSPTAR